jgi:beta-lactamase class A
MRKLFLCGLILSVIVIFCLGILAGWLISNVNQETPTISSVRNETPYSLINPLLYLETSQDLSFPKYTALKNAITDSVATDKSENKASDIAVYFRDLNSNDWVGINYTDEFDAASMLKVVTLISLLHVSENSPSVLSGNINVPVGVVIPSTGEEQDFFPPSNPVTSGNTYSIQYLMTQLITQSDNGANALLLEYIGNDALQTVFTELHVPAPGTSDTLDPQEYSHLFRVLYNASYLTPADSNEALQLLSQTTFTGGLVAGVPASTTVAHKFGESTSGTGTATIHELHDCGIVYYPGHPYFLCVMTRGTSFSTLEGVIQNISKITWSQVSAIYPK